MDYEALKRCHECGRLYDGMECPECGYYAQEYADPEMFDDEAEFEYNDDIEEIIEEVYDQSTCVQTD